MSKIFDFLMGNSEVKSLKEDIAVLQQALIDNPYNNLMFQLNSNLTPIYSGDNKEAYMKKGYQGNEDVYSIVTKIATKCAMCPVILYEVKSTSDMKRYKSMKNATEPEGQFMASVYRTKALKEVERHSILEILERPNPHQSGFEWTMASIIFMLTNGNSYNYGVEGMYKGIYQHLYNLPAHLTSIVGGGKFEPVKGYTVNWATEKLPFEAHEVWHMKYPGFNFDQHGSHLYGQSPLQVALKNTLERNNAAAMQATRQMNNAGMLGIISNDAEKFQLKDSDKKALEDKLTDKLKSKRDFDRWIVSNGKLNWTQLGFSAKDLELLSTLQWDQKKLCNIYGFPIQLLNSEAASTDNNMKWSKENYINDTIAPLLSQFDDGLNRFFVRPFSKKDGKEYYIEHDISAYPEMQGNMKELTGWLKDAWWIKGKDKQAVMKFTQDEADPAMNQYLIPSNLIPAEDLGVPDKEFDESSEKSIDY